MADFQPGDRVRCVDGNWPLAKGAIYTIGERLEMAPGDVLYSLKGHAPRFLWGGYRFRKVVDWTADEVPVVPETVTVLGSRVTDQHASWRGLDLSRAVVLEHATIMSWLVGPDAPPDHHLNVPFAHPNDPPEYWEGCMYRVRPRRTGWRFHKTESGAWVLRREVKRGG
jgi:hypothetical protein